MSTKKQYVVHLTPLTGMIASVGIAKFISDKLKLPTISTKEECEAAMNAAIIEGGPRVRERIDTVIVVNGPPAFCRFREELAELLSMTKKWVWAQNDYAIYPPSQVNKVARRKGWVSDKGFIRPPVYWTTIPDRVEESHDAYINWNALTLFNLRRESTARKSKKSGIVYYGAFRDNRVAKFRKYLPDGVVVSAPGRASGKFETLMEEEGRSCTIVSEFSDLSEELSRYSATVLMQDGRSDKRFMSLPNRFYECLSCEVAQFISEEMVESVEKGGFPVKSRWVVGSHEDIDMRMARRYAHQQQDEWLGIARAQHRAVSVDLQRAWRKVCTS